MADQPDRVHNRKVSTSSSNEENNAVMENAPMQNTNHISPLRRKHRPAKSRNAGEGTSSVSKSKRKQQKPYGIDHYEEIDDTNVPFIHGFQQSWIENPVGVAAGGNNEAAANDILRHSGVHQRSLSQSGHLNMERPDLPIVIIQAIIGFASTLLGAFDAVGHYVLRGVQRFTYVYTYFCASHPLLVLPLVAASIILTSAPLLTHRPELTVLPLKGAVEDGHGDPVVDHFAARFSRELLTPVSNPITWTGSYGFIESQLQKQAQRQARLDRMKSDQGTMIPTPLKREVSINARVQCIQLVPPSRPENPPSSKLPEEKQPVFVITQDFMDQYVSPLVDSLAERLQEETTGIEYAIIPDLAYKGSSGAGAVVSIVNIWQNDDDAILSRGPPDSVRNTQEANTWLRHIMHENDIFKTDLIGENLRYVAASDVREAQETHINELSKFVLVADALHISVVIDATAASLLLEGQKDMTSKHLQDAVMERRLLENWLKVSSAMKPTTKKWQCDQNDLADYRQAKIVHMFFAVSDMGMTISDVTFLALAYLIVFLYISFSIGRFHLVKSKYGLGLTAVVVVFAATTMAIGLCTAFGMERSLLAFEVIPFLVLAIGVENIFVITNAVIETPLDLPVKVRVAKGIRDATPTLVKSLVTELIAAIIGLQSNVPAIHEFSVFAFFAIGSDVFLQITMFTAVLSIDIRRSELGDLYIMRQHTMTPSGNTTTGGSSNSGVGSFQDMTSYKSGELPGIPPSYEGSALRDRQNSREFSSGDQESLLTADTQSLNGDGKPRRTISEQVSGIRSVRSLSDMIEQLHALLDTIYYWVWRPWMFKMTVVVLFMVVISLGFYTTDVGSMDIAPMSSSAEHGNIAQPLYPVAHLLLGRMHLPVANWIVDLLPPLRLSPAASSPTPFWTPLGSRVLSITWSMQGLLNVLEGGRTHALQRTLAEIFSSNLIIIMLLGVPLTISVSLNIFFWRLWQQTPIRVREDTESPWSRRKAKTLVQTLTGHQEDVELLLSNGTVVVSGDAMGVISVWDLQHATILSAHPTPNASPVWSGCLKGNVLLIGTRDGHILQYRLPDMSFSSRAVDGRNGGMTRDNSRLGDAFSDTNMPILQNSWGPVTPEDAVTALSMSASGAMAVIGTQSGRARVLDLASGQINALKPHGKAICCADFLGPTNRVAIASRDRTVSLHDASDLSCICTLYGHTGAVTSLVVDEDKGERALTASTDGLVRCWDVVNGSCLAIMEGHQGPVCALDADFDTMSLAVSSSEDETIRIWDLETGAVLRSLYQPGSASAIHLMGSGLLFTAGMGSLKVWNLADGDCINIIQTDDNVYAPLPSRVLLCFDDVLLCEVGKEIRIIRCLAQATANKRV
eukprot:Clim_evm2s69 gene=Clim_evmTU2s69